MNKGETLAKIQRKETRQLCSLQAKLLSTYQSTLGWPQSYQENRYTLILQSNEKGSHFSATKH